MADAAADHGRRKSGRRHDSFLLHAAAQVMMTVLIMWGSSGVAAAQRTPSWTTTLTLRLAAAPNETFVPDQSVAGLVSPSWVAASNVGYSFGLAVPRSSTSTIMNCTLGIFQGSPADLVWAWQAARVPVATSCDVLFSSGAPLFLFANLTSRASAATSADAYGSWPPLNDSAALNIHALALTDSGILLALNSTNHTVWQSNGAGAVNSTSLLDCPSQICSAAAAAPPAGSPASLPSASPRSALPASRHFAMLVIALLSTAALVGVRA